jgi:hypothetical protein
VTSSRGEAIDEISGSQMKTLIALLLLTTAVFANDANRLVGHWVCSGNRTIYNSTQANFFTDLYIYPNGAFESKTAWRFTNGTNLIVIKGVWFLNENNTLTLTSQSISEPLKDDIAPMPDFPDYKPFKGELPLPAPYSTPVQFVNDNTWEDVQNVPFSRA